MDLPVGVRRLDDRVVVSPSGELDLYTAPSFQSMLVDLLREGTERLVVDMSEVSFCDSSGVNVLLTALKRARAEGGTVILAGVKQPVSKVFEITGLQRVFVIHPTAADALASPEE
ncbi:MAG: STAS domain-containing protein [Streptosporangiaceae bacterium]